MRRHHQLAGIITLGLALTGLLPTQSQAQDTPTHNNTAEATIESQLRSINLPLVILETTDGTDPTCEPISAPPGCTGNGITNNEYVKGRVRIVTGDDTLYDSGDYTDGESGMRVKVRGNSSAYTTCTSLKVKLQKKADLLFRGQSAYKDKEWLLLNYYSTYNLKTELGFRIGELVGMPWEPAHRFVNLMMNGKYRGLYMLSEAVKRADTRVQTTKSGFLIEADPYWWNTEDSTFHTAYLPYSVAYSFKYPDDIEDQTTERISQIRNYIADFETKLTNGEDVSTHIDIPSFAAWMLAHDVLGSFDGLGSNIFLTKEDYVGGDSTSTKLKMGPLWDFDSACLCEGTWASAHDLSDFYFKKLFQNEDFVLAYKAAWASLREKLPAEVAQLTDSIQSNQGEAIEQSRQLTFNELGQYPYVSMADNVKEITDWFSTRIPWMDESVAQLSASTSIGSPVTGTPQATAVSVYDASGMLHLSASGQQATGLLRGGPSALQLQRGIYLLRVQYPDGTAQTLKWVKP